MHPTYRLRDGTRVPSVTTVLGRWGDKEGLLYWANELGQKGQSHREARDEAAGIGTIVHEMVEAHIQDRAPKEYTPADLKVDEETYTDMLAAAGRSFVAYLAWRSMVPIDIVATETSMVSEDYRFGGTPDAVGRTPLGLALLDWKSSNAMHHGYIAQVAAYSYLWKHGHCLVEGGRDPHGMGEDIGTAHLLRFDKRHGTFTHAHLTPAVLRTGWQMFKSLLDVYTLDSQLKGAI